MHAVRLAHATDLAGWRDHARALLAAMVPPEAVTWSVAGGEADLFAQSKTPPPPPAAAGASPASVPRAFLSLAETVIHHRSPERFALLYRLLWRQARGEKTLLAVRVDPDVARAADFSRAVTRDAHHMKGFLRFRETADGCFVAWYEPDHHVVDMVAPLFSKRLATMRWSILTPDRSAHWDGETLSYAEGADKARVPDGDALEAYWKTYYASVFNPARLNTEAMRRQMPRRYWAALPEAGIIAPLVHAAGARTQTMLHTPPGQPRRPRR